MGYLAENRKTISIVMALVVLCLVFDGVFTGFIIRFASTQYVTRVISQPTLTTGSQLNVTLHVGVLLSNRFYYIDEIIPSGWTITDSGGMDTSESGHLKVVVPQNAVDISYNYTLTAPSTPGQYVFSGNYRIENMSGQTAITGDTLVDVEVSSETCNGIDDDLDTFVDEGCDDDNDDYCDSGMTRAMAYSCSGTTQCCPSGGGDCDDTNQYINPGSNPYCDCNSGTGGGATVGTTEVCGDGIDQDCDGADLLCCAIIGAAWNESQVEDAQAVMLSVNGSTICGDGEVVVLELWESDGGTSEEVTSINLGTMTLMNDYASSEWNAVWIRDTGDNTSDPEYFFRAELQSNAAVYNLSDLLRVTTDDEDRDGVHDDIDCNDVDPGIGQCTGCAVCSDPAGYNGTCISGGTCGIITCGALCGYGICVIDQRPQFNSPTEPSVCEITGDNGECTTDCVNYACAYDALCDTDDDDDGVPDVDDRCPNTSPADRGRVNIYGCPKPITLKFTPDLTTNFSIVDLFNITNMTLGITGLGQINFLGNTTMLIRIGPAYTSFDLDPFIFIERGRVSIEVATMNTINRSSIIRLFDLTVRWPVIKRDGVVCWNCEIIHPQFYHGAPGNPDNLTFSVPGFTEYRIDNSTCGDDYCYLDVENCSSCQQDCGECPKPCTDNDGDYYTIESSPPEACCGPGRNEACLGGSDCNDSDSGVNPDMIEVPYNGKDDDCNISTKDYDLDGDLNNASSYGGTDCNDNNNSIGQCEGCASCSDPSGMSGVCQADNAQCDPITCPITECSYGNCSNTQVANFSSPTEPTTCTVMGDTGTCGPENCQNYQCVDEVLCGLDSDGDSVPDLTDRCPNTAVNERPINRYGCPVPIATLFTPDLTTNFSNVDLINLTNMTLGVTNFGQIKFLGNTTIMRYSTMNSRYNRIDMDANVNVSHNLVSVNSTALGILNRSSIIKLFNLTWARPLILRNGVLCGSGCGIIQYVGSGVYKNLTFSVAGFTNYSTQEHYCGDGRCDSDINESCSSCAADCGTCPPTRPPGTIVTPPPSSLTCGTRPVQPCPAAVWEDYPDCEWNTSQCIIDTDVCTVNETRCLGSSLQRCENRSPALWYVIETCQYGCNLSTISCNSVLTACQEDWSCGAWSNCTNGQQTRLCFDLNDCNTFVNKPLEVRACGLPPPLPMDLTIIIAIVVIVILVLVAAVMLKTGKGKKKLSLYERAILERKRGKGL